jgi:two-component system sensor histidine kinase ChiS
VASRVEELTKRYGAGLVISEQTLLRLQDRTDYSFRFVDKVQVKGKKATVSVFEVFDGSSKEMMALKLETRADFEQGLSLYYDRQFPEASVHFNTAHYMIRDVPNDWNGTQVMPEQ